MFPEKYQDLPRDEARDRVDADLVVNMGRSIDHQDEALNQLVKETSEPTATAEELASLIDQVRSRGFVEGAKVARKHDLEETAEIGEVVGYNQKLNGLYPGIRYPLIVEFPDSGQFEFSEEDLRLLTHS